MTDAPRHQARLTFITGLRGVAALVVAVGHSLGMVGPDRPSVPIWETDLPGLLSWPWTFGGPAVWLFIMLSGFALYWAEESRRERGDGGTPLRVYARRRLWRILPTYYAALALGALVVLGLGAFLIDPSPSLHTYEPVSLSGVVSHLFMVQNLSPGWRSQIQPPLWSIAVEMQLYVLFPLLYLIRRWFGIYVAGAGLIAVVFVLNQLVSVPVLELVEWFVVGALLAHFLRRHKVSARFSMPVALGALTVGFVRMPVLSGRPEQGVWLVAFASLLVWLFTVEGRGGWEPLGSRYAVWLGERSYSLYAVHFPIALLCWAAVGRLGLDRSWAIPAIIVTALPVSLLVASASYRWIERPSMARSRGAGQSGVRAPAALTGADGK